MAVGGPWLFTNATGTKMLDGTFASGSSWKIVILTSASNISASSTTYAGLTGEHANVNGYTTGGIAVTASLVDLTGPRRTEWRFAVNPVWTAVGGPITGKWHALYKVGGDVWAYCLADAGGADVTATAGNTFTTDSDGTPGPVFTFTF